MAKPEMTYKLAMAIMHDAASRSMRAAGRTAWSEEDYNVGVDELNGLLTKLNAQPAVADLVDEVFKIVR